MIAEFPYVSVAEMAAMDKTGLLQLKELLRVGTRVPKEDPAWIKANSDVDLELATREA